MAGTAIRGLAAAGGLQPAQPLPDEPFGALVALPLIFDLQPGPLIGVGGLQIGAAEHAIRRGLRREKGRIWPANRGFLRFRAGRRRRSLCRFRRGARRAAGKRSKQRQRDRQAAARSAGLSQILSGIARSGLSSRAHPAADAAMAPGPPTKRRDHGRQSLNQILTIKVNANLPDLSASGYRAHANSRDRRRMVMQASTRRWCSPSMLWASAALAEPALLLRHHAGQVAEIGGALALRDRARARPAGADGRGQRDHRHRGARAHRAAAAQRRQHRDRCGHRSTTARSAPRSRSMPRPRPRRLTFRAARSRRGRTSCASPSRRRSTRSAAACSLSIIRPTAGMQADDLEPARARGRAADLSVLGRAGLQGDASR